ncbi:MAG TPA: pitrilysin family protein [Thermoanaerobaculia bacterium]|nr:pitrilysin family protein [Thermoanaerobaculia bacterium]
MILAILLLVIPSVSEESGRVGGTITPPPAAQIPRSARNDITDVERHRLDNGLEVWIRQRQETQAVEVRVVVRAGFRYEEPLDSGLSHLLEHMLFKGTERQTESQLKWEVERRGGSRNGITTLDSTWYYVNIRDAHFPFAVDWLEDIVFHSRLSEEHLRQARKDVYSEQGGKYPRILERIFLTGLFQPPEVRAAAIAFPHAQVPERVIANLEHIDAAAARRHFARYYRPENMAVIVVGNVDPAAALAEIRRRFGAPPSPAPERAVYVPYREPREVDEIRTRFYPPVGQMTDVRHGIWTRGRRDPDRLVIRLICRHLDRRLKEEVRYKRALAYSVGCAAYDGLDAGAMFGYAEGERSAEDEVKELMRAVVREVIDRDLTAQEITDAREAVIGTQIRYYENNSRLADYYQDLFLTVPFGRPLPDDMAALEAITAADIRRVARSRLQPEAMLFVVARPPLTYVGTAILLVVVVALIVALIVLRLRRRRRAA